MRQNLIKYGLRVAPFLAAVVPLAASAQTLPPPPFTNPGSAIALLCSIAGWMFTFLVVLSVIFVIWAAFKYLTAGGDPAKVGAASSMLIYAAVAIAVAIFAKGFPLLVGGLLNNTAVTGC